MHVYFYDPICEQSKYSVLLAKIETKLTDLGLNGKIIRLSLLHNLEKTISDEAKPGRTLIFVGTDNLFNLALSYVAKHDLVIGYIPITPKQPLANTLGIHSISEACEIIAARRVVNLDLGLVNEMAFLSEFNLHSSACSIDINNCTLEVKEESDISVVNMPLSGQTSESNPGDQLMEFSIKTKDKQGMLKKAIESISYLQSDKFFLTADNASAKLDQINTLQPPYNIRVLPSAINMIVGKTRSF